MQRLIDYTIPSIIKTVGAPLVRCPSEWAKAERVMPQGTPEPGPVRPERNPYLIDVARAFTLPPAKRITFITGTQAGKSFLQENVIGHRMDDDPCPILFYAPTESNITKKVEPIMLSMIRSSKNLSEKYNEKNSTQFVKRCGASTLYLSFLGSATETASTSARLILLDELDRASKNCEGSVQELVEARGDAYPDSKVGFTASPTVGRVERAEHLVTKFSHWDVKTQNENVVSSPIWREWQNGSRHEWAVPCPHCKHYFVPWSGLLWWPEKDSDNECSPTHAEKEARLSCPNNGCLIADKYRQAMNAKGVYVAPGQTVEKGKVIGVADTQGNSHFSYWVSGLCSFSAKKSYGFLAKKLMLAQLSNDPDVLQPVFNTGFGECYSPMGDAPDWVAVRNMAWKYYSGQLLGSPEFILCTVDVQKNRLEYVVRGWFQGMGSALIEEGQLWGPTLHLDVWDQLQDIIEKSYNGIDIKATGVDCGYNGEQVFNFVRKNKGRCYALRGSEIDKPYRAIKMDVTKKGKVMKRGDLRWDFDSRRAKTWVHTRIGWDKDKPAFWVLPADISDDYCKEIVGEEFNQLKGKWIPVGENHKLDCEAMQYVLAQILGLKRKKGLTRLSDFQDIEKTEDNQEPIQPEIKKPSLAKKIKKHVQDNWLGGVDTDNWV